MTQHSVKEMKRQYELAAQKKQEADKRFTQAEQELTAALLRQSGYLNKIVITKAHPHGVLVNDATIVDGRITRYRGRAVNVDGTVGQRIRVIYMHDRVREVREVSI